MGCATSLQEWVCVCVSTCGRGDVCGCCLFYCEGEMIDTLFLYHLSTKKFLTRHAVHICSLLKYIVKMVMKKRPSKVSTPLEQPFTSSLHSGNYLL